MNGPPYTVTREQRLPGGRVELLIRENGGREVKMRLTALAALQADRDALIVEFLGRLRPVPSYYAN